MFWDGCKNRVGEIHAPQHCILDLILLVTALAEFSYGEEPLNSESHRLGFTVMTTKACSNFDQGSVRGLFPLDYESL